ncbi:MAG TPA: hypothetical protein PLD23_14985 [Armatimonadota bacterium]|nr:hypothetical protein [Armatimonadota bacterium]HQK94812.1 hypothetical protein [Armatimonadota bacterium]
MKHIVVVDFATASCILGAVKDVDAVVSIGDPGSAPPPTLHREGRQILRLEFHDVERDSVTAEELIAAGIPSVGFTPPSREMVRELLDWSPRLLAGEGTLVCHCLSGLSRSTACAAVLAAVDRGPGGELAAMATVASRTQHVFMPNRAILRLADELRGPGSRLLEAYDTWRTSDGEWLQGASHGYRPG